MSGEQANDGIPPRFRADVLRHIGHGGEADVFELTAAAR
jgi:hypothetical protein